MSSVRDSRFFFFSTRDLLQVGCLQFLTKQCSERRKVKTGDYLDGKCSSIFCCMQMVWLIIESERSKICHIQRQPVHSEEKIKPDNACKIKICTYKVKSLCYILVLIVIVFHWIYFVPNQHCNFLTWSKSINVQFIFWYVKCFAIVSIVLSILYNIASGTTSKFHVSLVIYDYYI